METKALSLRWLHCAGYEIKLPDGRTIVIDPFITTNHFENFTWEDIEGADYILLTHTHGDHTADVGNLVEKFGSQVFVGMMSCNALVEYFDLNYSYIWPVIPGNHFELDGLTIDVLFSKHTTIFRDNYKPSMAYDIPDVGKGPGTFRDCNHFGGMEMLNYMITTKEGLRIMISGGLPALENAFLDAKKFRPNIVILQCGAKDPAGYAADAARYGAQFVFPHHHEKIPNKWGMSIAEYCDQANEALAAMGSLTRVVDPGKFTWCDITLGAVVKGA